MKHTLGFSYTISLLLSLAVLISLQISPAEAAEYHKSVIEQTPADTFSPTTAMREHEIESADLNIWAGAESGAVIADNDKSRGAESTESEIGVVTGNASGTVTENIAEAATESGYSTEIGTGNSTEVDTGNSAGSGTESSTTGNGETDGSGNGSSLENGSDSDPFSEPEEPILSASQLNLIANAGTYLIELYHAETAEFATSDATIVEVSAESTHSALLTPKAAGHAMLTATIPAQENALEPMILTCEITVYEPSISSESATIQLVGIANGYQSPARLSFSGINLDQVYYASEDHSNTLWEDIFYETNDCQLTSDDPDIATAELDNGSLYIYGHKKGSTKISFTVYGRQLKVRVKVKHMTMNKYTVNTYKGHASTILRVKGAGSQKVTWSSGNKKVATVRAGVVTPKGIGTTHITAKVGTYKLVCIYSVSSKLAYRTVKQARNISQTKGIQYSQKYRMSKKYYDCSSLVWRCYRNQNILFGYSKTASNAPTAAGEGWWSDRHRKTYSYKAMDITTCKLVAGDIICYAFAGNNGRYRNISHIAIFSGYGIDENGQIYGNVIEASSSRNSVVERQYYPSDSIVLIARPAK